MNALRISVTLLAGLFSTAAPSQDWTDEQLVAACAGFQSETLTARLQQVGKLLADRKPAFTALVARIHGDYREYQVKIERLLEELGDPRWQVRENAERTLIEIGGRAMGLIQQRKENPEVLEQALRCSRIYAALTAKGTEEDDRERRLLRGLVTTALYLDSDPRLLRALRSALGHTEQSIAESAIRALGKHGGDDEVGALMQIVRDTGSHRLVSVSAIARMRSDKALALCRELLMPPAAETQDGLKLTRSDAMAMIRTLHGRQDDGAKALLKELEQHPDPVLAAGARIRVPPATKQTKAAFTLPDRARIEAAFGGFFGESQLVIGGFEGLPTAELAFSDCDTIDFPEHAAAASTQARVFLNQGTLVSGEIVAIDPESVKLKSPLFGDLTLPRKEIQGIALDPTLDRLVGASVDHDRVRLRSSEFVDGDLIQAGARSLTVQQKDGAKRDVEVDSVAGMLFKRPRALEADPTSYARIDLTTGERLIGFLADSSSEHLAVSVPLLGAAVVPLAQVVHMELNVGGGAMWGFTLIADYSDNRIVEVDDQGRVVFVLEEIFGAWDAECLDNGNLLITEFSVSRVQEVDRKGKQIWVFEDLKNPYDADRLPNGNTLIADTFASRVIEVDKEGKIVWSFAKDIRPFDCDRLANGNTLIADVLKDRVIEVNPSGEIVWELKNLLNTHDVDRLPNGNTLVTLRQKGCVLEFDRDGKVVFELQGLSSPSDADRLPNGNTIVAENTRVREFDRRGNVVWQKEMTWAVEVNRY
ncbi:MAG TPA: hypothetical protein VF384_13375 [Planctomycetota bacterium]